MVAGLSIALGSCAGQQQQSPQQVQLAQAVSAPPGLYPREPLSEAARTILRARMQSHARDMRELTASIMLLRYPDIEAGARRINGDVSLSRPLSSDATELNSALPEKFFLYQDEVRLEAKTLAEAAQRQNALDVADSYGHLSQVCVRCHATYRAGR